MLRYVDEQLAWKWLAPEVMQERRLRPSSDVWSFGILVIELLQYGAEPYPGLCTMLMSKMRAGFKEVFIKDFSVLK